MVNAGGRSVPGYSQHYEANNRARCTISVLLLDMLLILLCSYHLVVNTQIFRSLSLIKAMLQNSSSHWTCREVYVSLSTATTSTQTTMELIRQQHGISCCLKYFYTPLLRPLSKTSEQPKRKAPHCVSEELAPHAWLGTNAWSLVNHHCPVLRIPTRSKWPASRLLTPLRSPGEPTN